MKAYGREEVQLHTSLTLYSCTLGPQKISCPPLYVNLPSPQEEQVILSLITYLGILIFMGYWFLA